MLFSQQETKYVAVLHEQAGGFAAEGYVKGKEKIPELLLLQVVLAV